MRVLIFDTVYPAVLRWHYSQNPGLEERPYAEQWRALMDTFFGTADSYSHYLGLLGHDAHEIVLNCTPLQQAWAREHDLPQPRRRRFRPMHEADDRLAAAQVEAFRPDVVYFQSLEVLAASTLRQFRDRGLLVAGQVATDPPSARRLRSFDLVVTSMPHLAERFRRDGVRSEYLPLAFDPRVNERLERDEAPREQHDAVFVGSLKRFRRWSANQVLERAARRAPIEFWGYGAGQWPRRSPLRAAYRGVAWGLDMYGILRAARISLNRHVDLAGEYANNMRLYEATGVRSLLLTDRKANLGELFEVGGEVVDYAGEDELVRKIRHFLDHPDERRAIARAGQKRTLREHSYPERMRELAALLERAL